MRCDVGRLSSPVTFGSTLPLIDTARAFSEFPFDIFFYLILGVFYFFQYKLGNSEEREIFLMKRRKKENYRDARE